MADPKKVWFVTGVSSGFGKCLVEELVKTGMPVTGTLRQPGQVKAFNECWGDKALGVLADVTKPEQVKGAVRKTLERYGRLDVVVNNAGFGLIGTVEETSLEEARDLMETNFFGVLNVLQETLPILRDQGSGHILQLSSIGGFRATPGCGLYTASKFALEGLSEAMAGELAPFNVKVTLVEPGPFRTGFAGYSLKQSKKKVAAYGSTPAGEWIKKFPARDGKQEGDPVKAARLMMEVVETPDPPLRLPLGPVTYEGFRRKIESVQNDMAAWKDKNLKTSFEN
jgi:NAD(P)-dependent dehydrogenase (short-subunit alcohol dehydrogenase family)